MKKNIYENPVIEFLDLVGKLIILNFCWMLCCIPVVTIGAATSAMYSVMFKVVDDKERGTFLPYFKAFKDNFLQSTALWFIISIAGLIFGFDLYYAVNDRYLINKAFLFISIVGLMVLLNILTLIFSLQARYQNTVKNHLKNSLIIAYSSPLKIIMVWLVWALPIVLTIYSASFFRYFGFIWFVCGFSTLFYFSAKIIISIFRKINQEERQKTDLNT